MTIKEVLIEHRIIVVQGFRQARQTRRGDLLQRRLSILSCDSVSVRVSSTCETREEGEKQCNHEKKREIERSTKGRAKAVYEKAGKNESAQQLA